MQLTRTEVAELRERSKDDRAIIVGSEVRQLCDLADLYLDSIEPVKPLRSSDHTIYMPLSTRFTETHHCPRRAENPINSANFPNEDRWDAGETCTYCGSLHPDVFMERLEAGTIKLNPTSKSYKVYVIAKPDTEPFVQVFRGDDCPGGDDPSKWKWTQEKKSYEKFYWMHLSKAQQLRFIELLNQKRVDMDYPFNPLPYFIAR